MVLSISLLLLLFLCESASLCISLALLLSFCLLVFVPKCMPLRFYFFNFYLILFFK